MSKHSGVTFIELLVVLAIIGILAGIAMPSYQSHLRRMACEDAKTALVGFGNAMERYRAQHGSFTGADKATIYPSESPINGAPKQFDLSIRAVSADAYQLSAIAKGNGYWGGASPSALTLDAAGMQQGSAGFELAWERCPSHK